MSAPAAPPSGRLARLMRSRVTLIAAAVLTLALVAAATVTAIRFFAPEPAAVALGSPMPAAFTIETQVGGSPFLTRGQKGTVLVSVRSEVPLASLELWDGENPYIVIDDPALIRLDTFGILRIPLDYVPLNAGGHILFARATDAEGGVAQSAPTAMSVLDQPHELGIDASDDTWLDPGDMTVETVPGDTLETVAERLAVPVEKLAMPVFDPDMIAAGGAGAPVIDPAAVLSTGTTIAAPVALTPPAPEDQKFPQITWKPGLTAKVTDCQIEIDSHLKVPVRLYGGPGNVFLGEVLGGGATILANSAIGKTVITGLPSGTTKPLQPISATVPDECAKDGWKGDAYITGGVLLTDKSLTKPFVYISVDKGQWARVPAAEGSTLADGQINDLRPYMELASYDQIDLEVWTTDGVSASRAASGQFCRKNASAAGAGSSASGGECQPAKLTTGAPGGGPLVAADFQLKVTPASGSFAHVLEPVAGSLSGQTIYGPGKITLDTNGCSLGYTNVRYQFSYFPISAGSPGVLPPGVFHYEDAFPCSTYGAITIDPGVWHFSSITDAQTGDDALALDDQVAMTTATANLASGAPVVGNIFIRAIAVDFLGGKNGADLALGAVTRTAEVVYTTNVGEGSVKIPEPTVTLVPGVDENASWTSVYDATSNWNPSIQTHGAQGVGGTCVQVAKYPKPHVWTYMPTTGPHSEYHGSEGQVYVAGNEYYSDLALAQRRFESQKAVYCVDDAAEGKRWTEAYNAAKENAKCTISCVITFVIYGAMQGFLVGGPVGALVGTIGGLYLGVLSYASPGFYADLKSAWDAVAAIYNVAFSKVAAVLDKFDPVCGGLSYLSDKAGAFCTKTVHVAAQAVVSYYTGLPPSLATSDELEAAADGQLEGAFRLVLDAGLNELGLDCDSFTLDATEAKKVANVADGQSYSGGGKPAKLDGCGAIAGLVTEQVRTALDSRQAQVMGAIINLPPIQGLVIVPITDRVPAVVITSPEPSYTNWGAGCVVIANTTVTENGVSHTLKPTFTPVVLQKGIPTAAGTAPSKPFWFGQIPVGVVPQTWWTPRPTGTAPIQSPDFWQERKHTYLDPARVLHQEKADAKAPYLHVELSSECFTKVYVFDVPKYAGVFEQLGGTVPAFRLDNRSAVGFH